MMSRHRVAPIHHAGPVSLWVLSMPPTVRARRPSRHTPTVCGSSGAPVSGASRPPEPHEPAWLGGRTARPRSATATARSRQLAARRFTGWLAEECEIPVDPVIGIAEPKLDAKVVAPRTNHELRRLVKACVPLKSVPRSREDASRRRGCRPPSRRHRPRQGVATVRRGKGGKGRVVPFGPYAALAVDRHLRTRTRHASRGAAPTSGSGTGASRSRPTP